MKHGRVNRYLLLVGALNLIISGRLAWATVFPISPELIQKTFSNDALAESLEKKLADAEGKIAALRRDLKRYKRYEEPPAFTHAKYKVTFTLAQIEEWRKNGWVKTNEFGWPILRKKIEEVLPGWIETFCVDVEKAKKTYPGRTMPKKRLKKLLETLEEITDFLALQRHYVNRTRNWDAWCRKGPWLLEDSPPNRLSEEISLLEDYFGGRVKKKKIQESLFAGRGRQGQMDDRDLAECLDAKKTVYNWYYGFGPGRKQGIEVALTPRGYELGVSICVGGKGARHEAAALVKTGIETYWTGNVGGIPFQSKVAVHPVRAGKPGPRECLKIRIGDKSEKNLWPSDVALPYHFDKETAAHEFGHALGFRDRYRDVYDFKTGTYKVYQWDLFGLMSGQNGPDPGLSEDDLEKVVEHYLVEPKRRPKTDTQSTGTSPHHPHERL